MRPRVFLLCFVLSTGSNFTKRGFQSWRSQTYPAYSVKVEFVLKVAFENEVVLEIAEASETKKLQVGVHVLSRLGTRVCVSMP